MPGSSGRGGWRAALFLGAAMVASSGAVLAVYQVADGYQRRIDEARRPADTVMVIVAARDLYQGVLITEDDLYAVQIEPRFLPEGVFLSPEHLVGRIPRERILANEFVRADRLARPEAGTGLETVIPRGMRAISLEVANGPALEGLLAPASYVDVLVTLEPRDGPAVTRTIAQAVFVLAVNGWSAAHLPTDPAATERPRRPSVTLLATVDLAEQLAHARNVGDITLSLRSDVDAAEAELHGADLDDLRSAIAPPPPAPVRPAVRRQIVRCTELEQIHGARSKVVLVDEQGRPCPTP